MRVGLFLPSVSPYATPEYLAAFAGAAEEHGFASIWLGEHVVFVDEYDSRYPYADDGRVGMPPDAGMLGLFPTIGFLAGVTTRVRIGTAVCLVPQRNPVYTAQDVATADWLSKGRIDFGVGIGWLREEFRALGVPWDERAARTEEYLDIMRALWRDDVAEHHGRFHDLTPSRLNPKPVQQPHPPIYFGGETDAALRRVARLGDGWHGFNHSPDTAAAHLARLDRFLADAGRTRSDIDATVAAYLRPVEPDDLGRYGDAGVDQLVLSAFGTSAHDVRDVIAALADSFVERAGAL